MKKLLACLSIVLLLASCEDSFTPRPHAFFRIDFPQKEFVKYKGACPYEFDIPYYSSISFDSTANSEPCWMNLNFLPYNATLHLTYKPIGQDFNLLDLQSDTRRFVMNHTIKAQEIRENVINKPEDHVHGVLYQLKGHTATSIAVFFNRQYQSFFAWGVFTSMKIPMRILLRRY